VTVDAAAGLCASEDGDCVAAYHSCPYKGISSQVDSSGIFIKADSTHNLIVYARCLCLDAWSAAGCTEEPPPPPTEEPWPDPYDSNSAHRRGSGGWGGVLVAVGAAVWLAGYPGIQRVGVGTRAET